MRAIRASRSSPEFSAFPRRLAPAHAQDWPAKQITIVVPFGAGGSADLLARILATHMQAKFGQTVVVENRAGAGGSIGTNYVAKAAPDGYTLLLGTVSSIAVNAALYAKLPFDVDKDLQPITQLVSFPNLLIVNPKLPVKTVQELIDYVKKNDGKVNYASSGRRHLVASLGGDVRAGDRHQDDARAVQIDRRRGQQHARRQHRSRHRQHDHGLAARQAGHGARARRLDAAAQRLGARGAGDRRDHQGLRGDRLAGPVRAGRHAEADRREDRGRGQAHLESAGGEGAARRMSAPIPRCPKAPMPSRPSPAPSG